MIQWAESALPQIQGPLGLIDHSHPTISIYPSKIYVFLSVGTILLISFCLVGHFILLGRAKEALLLVKYSPRLIARWLIKAH